MSILASLLVCIVFTVNTISNYLYEIKFNYQIHQNHEEKKKNFKLLQTPAKLTSNSNLVSSASASASEIVTNAYNQTYASLSFCPKEQSLYACMNDIKRSLEDNDNNKPWWFQTMLSHGENQGFPLHGAWHHLDIVNPPLHMCVIEKVGTKKFRELQCKMNGEFETKFPQPCNPEITPIPAEAPKVVFLRDPLERFLSGFLDKCVSSNRQEQSHCGPLHVLKSHSDNQQNMVDHFQDNNNSKKVLFEMFVDVIPLSWDLHFFPQSFYCDGIYRHIPKYDFVGYMGPNFHDDLHKFSQKYDQGSQLTDIVNSIFNVEGNRQQSNTEKHRGIETLASTKVEQYYTPKTLKKVLEYVSIDYVTLNLPIPSWAEKMLLGNEIIQAIV